PLIAFGRRPFGSRSPRSRRMLCWTLKTVAFPGGINAATQSHDAPDVARQAGANDREPALFSTGRHRAARGAGGGCRDRGAKATARAEVSWREGEWAQLHSQADGAQRRCDAHLRSRYLVWKIHL